MYTPARRYTYRFAAAMGVYVALVIATGWLCARLTAPWSWVVAAVPVVGLLAGAWALWRYLVEADEMLRGRLLGQLALASAVALLVGGGWGLAQFRGAPALNPFWLVVVWAGAFGATAVWTARRDSR